MTVSSLLGRSRVRPARPRTRAAGPRAGVAPVLVELTTHCTVRGGRIYQDAIYRHADGSHWLHYLPTETAA